ncbi:hypothetical protein ACFE04_027574 [Oxalis oulophora]
MSQMIGGDEIESSRIDLAEIRRSLTSSLNRRTSSLRLSSRRDEDPDVEYALMWAELERLPTVQRLRSSLFDPRTATQQSQSEATDKGKQIVDVTTLDALERRAFIDKLIKHIENDNLKLLKKIRRRMDKVGVELPKIDVRYKDLLIEAECKVVHGKPLPTLWNSLADMLNFGIMSGSNGKKAKIRILNDISGTIKPGRITLLLGPPGCGKTTFLKALSANLSHSLKITKREKEAGVVPDPDIDMYMKAISVKGQKTTVQTDYILKDQGQYWFRNEEPYNYVSVETFYRKFKESPIGKKLKEDISKPCDESQFHKDALSFSVYSLSKWEMFRACMSREYLLMKRNSFLYVFKTVQTIIVAVIAMTIFLRTRMSIDITHANLYLGALFFALVLFLVDGVPELSMTIERLEIFYRQKELRFYPAWAYGIPASILRIPLSVLVSFVWTALTYYVIGYSPQASRFFCHFLLLLGIHLSSTSMFRFVASFFQTLVPSTTAGVFAIITIMSFGGFVIGKNSMPGWLKWGFWISPLTYAEIGLSVNEFLAPRWQKTSSANSTIGDQVLKARGLDYEGYYLWISIGALAGFTLLFKTLFILALNFLKSPRSSQVITHEKLSQIQGSENFDIGANLEEIPKISPNAQAKSNQGRMVLPFQPLTIAFQNMKYYIDTPLVVIEIPYLFILAALYLVIIYPMVGYYVTAYKIFWCFYGMFTTMLYFNFLGMLLVALTPNIMVASILSSVFYTLFNLLCGFMVPSPSIPKWWVWLYYLIPTSWTLNGLLTSQYGDIQKEILIYGEKKTVAAFLEDYYGFHHDRLGLTAAILIAYPLLFAFLFSFFVGRLNYQSR